MCGVVGIWSFDQPDLSDAEMGRFTDTLTHRGPDGRGLFHDRGARLRLGHRRLAILDLSPSGHQPMGYANGRYWIVMNGEVYNFLELKEELETKGHRFLGASDTEVALAAYVEWGPDCQLRFNGMWAFAVWDRHERSLFLSRDRFGVKPLHYIVTDHYFAFASELKAFLALRCYEYGFSRDVVRVALVDCNALEGTEHTLLTGVKRLRGGHCLKLGSGARPEVSRWWRTLDHLPVVPSGFNDQVEHFRELFLDACRLRMRSDVPLGTSLSGGLDSSAVLAGIHAIAQGDRFTRDWQRAFVACFPGSNQDEEAYARQVIEAKGAVPVYTSTAVADWYERTEDIIFAIEDIHVVLLAGVWLNYMAMRKHGVAVSLDGHGSDELLGGYHFIVQSEMRRTLEAPFDLRRYLDLRSVWKGFAGGSNPIPSTEWADLALAARNVILALPFGTQMRDGWRFLTRRTTPLPEVWAGGMLEGFPRNHVILVTRRELSGLTRLNRELYSYFHDSTLPTILRNFDRCSMAHGVEVRMPFMDWRLVCFAFALPDRSKIAKGFSKRILREAMSGLLPDAIRRRTNKMGFSSPMGNWFRDGLADFARATVDDGAFLGSDLWDGPGLRKLVEDSLARHHGSALETIWPVLNAHRLMRLFDQMRTRLT